MRPHMTVRHLRHGALLAAFVSFVASGVPGAGPSLLSASVREPAASAQAGSVNLIVAPDGRPSNPGTKSRPLDLATALSARSPAGPGDTIWLRGGTYHGAFESRLTGSDKRPIVVRQVPGERAVIDGRSTQGQVPTLTVWGAHAWYWGFEVTNTDPNRSNRGIGLQIYGPQTRFINLVVHGTGNGFGVWSDAVDAELYGNLIYDSGWDAPDRGHGHSIYVQNQAGVKRIVDNLLFDSFSFGIHAYTEQGYIDNLHIEGNIAFNHGSLSKVSGPKANILVGGYRKANDPVLVSNYTYYPAGSAGRNVDLGRLAGCRGAVVTGNYFAGGVPLVLTACEPAEVQGNTFVGADTRSLARQFPVNTFLRELPATPTTVVRPNSYETGRAHVVVYNWTRQATVTLPLSGSGLKPGDMFEIRNAQDYFGRPVLRGTYRGRPVRLRMTPARGPTDTASVSAQTPEFGAFVVLKTESPAGRGDAFVSRLRPAGAKRTGG